ncbi:MAG TPA: hypothetical protein VD902_18430, partial [Symbiobacteriaceae bacterium]|nr:hypothetical protein [Symbiobacteriaceae bacterium]
MRKVMPLLLIAVFAGVMIYLFIGFGKFQADAGPPIDLTLPETWQEFSRTANTEGKDALALFQKEHEKKIRFKQGIRAEYTDGTTVFTMWVAPGSDEGNASQMVVEMSNKIGSTGKTFAASTMVDLGGGTTIFRTEGQDAVNYFFAKGRKVYWVAVKQGDAE